jgi:Flp pilus assembly protein TadD
MMRVAAIILGTLIAYWPAINGGFIWDDDQYLTANALLYDLEGLRQIWIPRSTPQYYPLVFTSFWVESHLWGFDPRGYHIVNVVLHIASALLLWRILVRIGAPAAWLIAAVFALHPVQVESVAWVTERKNVLSGLFYMLSASAYLRFDSIAAGESSSTVPRRWGWYALALVLFVAALLSKSVTSSLPVALVLVMLYVRRPMSIRALAPLVPFFVLGAVFGLHTAHLERTHVGATGPDFDLGFLQRLVIACNALLFYPWKVLIPYPLMFIYPRWNVDPPSPAMWAAIPVVIAVGVAAALGFVRGRRGPAIALAFFAVSIFPAIGFFNVYPMRFSFVADHFQYIACIGIIALAAGIGARWLAGSKAGELCAVIVLVVLGSLTWLQSRMYADLQTLWSTTALANPDAWIAQSSLGVLLRVEAEESMQRGDAAGATMRLRAAEERLRHALRLHDREPLNHANLGLVLLMQGHVEEGILQMRRAAELAPHMPDYAMKLAESLMRLNRTAEAVQWCRHALDHAADRPNIRTQGVFLLAQAARTTGAGHDEAIALGLDVVQQTQGRDPQAIAALADAYAASGRFDEAIEQLDRALAFSRERDLEAAVVMLSRQKQAYEQQRSLQQSPR